MILAWPVSTRLQIQATGSCRDPNFSCLTVLYSKRQLKLKKNFTIKRLLFIDKAPGSLKFQLLKIVLASWELGGDEIRTGWRCFQRPAYHHYCTVRRKAASDRVAGRTHTCERKPYSRKRLARRHSTQRKHHRANQTRTHTHSHLKPPCPLLCINALCLS